MAWGPRPELADRSVLLLAEDNAARRTLNDGCHFTMLPLQTLVLSLQNCYESTTPTHCTVAVKWLLVGNLNMIALACAKEAFYIQGYKEAYSLD